MIFSTILIGVGIFSIHSAFAEKTSGQKKHESSATPRAHVSHNDRIPSNLRSPKALGSIDGAKTHIISRIDNILKSLDSTSKLDQVRSASVAFAGTPEVTRMTSAAHDELVSKLNDLKSKILSSTAGAQIEDYTNQLTDLITPPQQ